MFTRRLVMNLRPDSASELARVTENEIVPLLRKQKVGLPRVETFKLSDSTSLPRKPHEGGETVTASRNRWEKNS